MDIDNQEDRFLAFIDHARSVLSSVDDEEIYDPNGNGSERGSEQRRSGLSKNRQEIMNRLKRKHRRNNSNTIDLYLHRSLEATWNENAARASFINLSFLPALLTSSCLHKLSCPSDLSNEAS
ncbi:hypothetical protein Peur_005844 [Populus x canadensis]